MIKAAMLVTTAFGMLYSSPCTVGDLGHNVVNGTLSFVKGYTADLLGAVVPSADTLIGQPGK